jgi:hypothetical protein
MMYYFIKKQGGVQKKQIEQYKNFVEAYNDETKLGAYFASQTQLEIIEYKKLSSTGTQGKTNRMRRNEILKKILE